VDRLQMNRPAQLSARRQWVRLGLFPGQSNFKINTAPEGVLPPVAAIHRVTHGARMLDTWFARPGGEVSHPAKSPIVGTDVRASRQRVSNDD
jgi:hypothetical protein